MPPTFRMRQVTRRERKKRRHPSGPRPDQPKHHSTSHHLWNSGLKRTDGAPRSGEAAAGSGAGVGAARRARTFTVVHRTFTVVHAEPTTGFPSLAPTQADRLSGRRAHRVQCTLHVRSCSTRLLRVKDILDRPS